MGKILLFPMNRSMVLARFENLDDPFDSQNQKIEVDLVKYCYSLWFDANQLPDPFAMGNLKTGKELMEAGYTDTPLISILEVDLTDNQPLPLNRY